MDLRTMNCAIAESRPMLSLSAFAGSHCRVERLSLVARVYIQSARTLLAFRFTPRRGCTSYDFVGAHICNRNPAQNALDRSQTVSNRRTKLQFKFWCAVLPLRRRLSGAPEEARQKIRPVGSPTSSGGFELEREWRCRT